MGTTDRLFDPDFPHGSPRGWDLGCRGGVCPNRGTEMPTCAEAHRRYAGDYAFRRDVDAGLQPRALGAAPLEAPAPPPPPRPRPAPAFSRAQTAASRAIAAPTSDREPATAPGLTGTTEPAPAPRKGTGRIESHPVTGPDGRRHGTMTGYGRGCRKGAPCPATPSCFEVAMDYYAARRRDQREAAPDTTPALAAPVVAVVQPDPPVLADVLVELALSDPLSVLASDLREAAEGEGIARRRRLGRLAAALMTADARRA